MHSIVFSLFIESLTIWKCAAKLHVILSEIVIVADLMISWLKQSTSRLSHYIHWNDHLNEFKPRNAFQELIKFHLQIAHIITAAYLLIYHIRLHLNVRCSCRYIFCSSLMSIFKIAKTKTIFMEIVLNILIQKFTVHTRQYVVF